MIHTGHYPVLPARVIPAHLLPEYRKPATLNLKLTWYVLDITLSYQPMLYLLTCYLNHEKTWIPESQTLTILFTVFFVISLLHFSCALIFLKWDQLHFGHYNCTCANHFFCFAMPVPFLNSLIFSKILFLIWTFTPFVAMVYWLYSPSMHLSFH